jgi:hypothetical protein
MFQSKKIKQLEKEAWEYQQLANKLQVQNSDLLSQIRFVGQSKNWRVLKYEAHEYWIKDDELDFVGPVVEGTDGFEVILGGQRLWIHDANVATANVLRLMFLNRDGCPDINEELKRLDHIKTQNEKHEEIKGIMLKEMA